MNYRYMENQAKWRTTGEDACQHQLSLETAHRKAFEVVCDTVKKDYYYYYYYSCKD